MLFRSSVCLRKLSSHARPHDFPERDDESFLKHTLVRWVDGRPELDWKDVTMTKWQPQERVY